MNFDPNQAPVNGTTPPAKLRFGAFSSSGNSSTGFLPEVSGALRYADPVLVKHPSLARIYLSALVIKGSSSYSIAVWYSANGGWNWSAPTELITASTLLDKPWIAVGPAPAAKFTAGPVRVRAASCPSAKLDRAAGRRRIGVAWHDASAPGDPNACIRFAAYNLDAGTWTSGLPVFAAEGKYDVMPALDYNTTNGTFVVTWYSFPSESSVVGAMMCEALKRPFV